MLGIEVPGGRPLVRGREADDADGGDSNSGVDGMIPESTFVSLTIR